MYNDTVYNVVSGAALIANVAVFVYMIYKAAKTKKNPYTKNRSLINEKSSLSLR